MPNLQTDLNDDDGTPFQELYAGGAVFSPSSGSIYISATADHFTCMLQEVNSETVIETLKNNKLETCTSLQWLNDDMLLWIGTEIQVDVPHGVLGRHRVSEESYVVTSLDQREYPMFVVPENEYEDSPSLYILSLVVNEDTDTAVGYEYPSWFNLVNLPSQPGSLKLSLLDEKLALVWQQTHEAKEANTDVTTAVLPAGLFLRDDFLMVVGSTAGAGGPFGPGDGNDMDGFISKFDWESGEIYVDPNPANGDHKSSIRFGSAADDWIIGSCHHQYGLDGVDSDAIYLVGASEGNNGNNPNNVPRGFVSKMDSLTLHTMWTTQFTPNISTNDDMAKTWATKCVVDESMNQIFIGGMVEDGTLGDKQTAFGKIDVFVARVSSGDGTLEWLRQMGSDQDDRLADMLLINDNNSLLIYGDTNGSFIRPPKAQREVILWTIEAENGAIEYPDLLTDPPTNVPSNLPTIVPTVAALITEAPVAAPIETTPSPVVVPETPAPVAEAAPTPPGPTLAPVATPSPTTSLQGDGSFLPGFEAPPSITENKEPPAKTQQTSSSSFSFLPIGTGFQSSMGPSYAGGMVYDFTRHAVYLTGSSYDSGSSPSCFLGNLQMVKMDWKELQTTTAKEPYDNHRPSACSPIAQVSDHLYTGGITEEVWENDPLQSRLANIKQFGIISQFRRDYSQPDWKFEGTASWIQDDIVQSPVSIISNDKGDSIFVASTASKDWSISADYNLKARPDFPNLTTGSGHLKYGSNYFITIQGFHPSDEPVTLSSSSSNKLVQDWVIQIKGNEEDSLMYVSGMAVLGESLVVVGGTKDDVTTVGGTIVDMNGFIAKLDPSSGDFVGMDLEESIRHFDAANDREDWIMNLCSLPIEDPNSFYVLGATRNLVDDGNVHAFVSKIDLETLDRVWTTLFYVKPPKGTDLGGASAFGCSIVPKQGLVYVAGVVREGATIAYDVKQPRSAGSDDLFVAQLETKDGSIRWLKQLGTSGRENLARTGGVLADMAGDAIVFGDTTGEFYRDRSASAEDPSVASSSDVFVVTLSKEDGSFSQTVETTRLERNIGIVAGVLIVLALAIYCYCRRRRLARKKMLTTMFSEETGGLMVSNSNGHVEMGGLRQHQPFKDRTVRPGRTII